MSLMWNLSCMKLKLVSVPTISSTLTATVLIDSCTAFATETLPWYTPVAFTGQSRPSTFP